MTDQTAAPSRTGLEHLRASVTSEVVSNSLLIRSLENFHVATRYDDLFSLEVDRLLATILSDSAQEGYAIAVVGKSGAGKSHTVKRRLDAHPAFKPFDDGYGNQMNLCLRVRTPAKCSTKSLGLAILRQAGYPIKRTTINEIEVWRLVGEQLRRRQTRIIYLDEAQHVLKEKDVKGRRNTQDTLKALMQNSEWSIWLILSGIPDMLALIEEDQDQQMERRSRVLEIGDMNEKDMDFFRSVIEAIADRVGYKIGFPLNDTFLLRLLHAGIRRQGMMIQLIKMSVECVLWDPDALKDKTIRFKHFVEGYRRLSNCSTSTNVFLVKEWAEIDREVDDKGKLTEATIG